jgi:hypothetical protein
MPVQAFCRFAMHAFDRRKVFRADLVRHQQLPGSIVAGLNQQVHRPLDQFGPADGLAMGQRPASGNADGVLQFGPVAPRQYLPVDPFRSFTFGGGCEGMAIPPGYRTPCYVTVTNRTSGSLPRTVTVTGHPGSIRRATFHIPYVAWPH